jgi:hypothetical protein
MGGWGLLGLLARQLDGQCATLDGSYFMVAGLIFFMQHWRAEGTSQPVNMYMHCHYGQSK